MVIYIYGSDSFKKDIHSLLNHSNIKFRLDEHGEIKDLKSLNELKEAIEDNPNNIYLIDDEKIIKKNSLNKKIKFLQAKDSIDQEYLLDNGIGDISVDSMDELATHIKKRLESLIHEKESSEIQESIVEMVEDAYEQDETKQYIQLDDELSELLAHNNSKEDDKLEDAVSLIDDIDNINKDDFSSLKDLNFEEDSDNIETIENKNIEEDVNIVETIQGDKYMSDDFSQFDTLKEDEILTALGDINTVDDFSNTLKESPSINKVSSTSDNIEVNGSNVNDIAELISKLLNNKTLEITIKVKN